MYQDFFILNFSILSACKIKNTQSQSNNNSRLICVGSSEFKLNTDFEYCSFAGNVQIIEMLSL